MDVEDPASTQNTELNDADASLLKAVKASRQLALKKMNEAFSVFLEANPSETGYDHIVQFCQLNFAGPSGHPALVELPFGKAFCQYSAICAGVHLHRCIKAIKSSNLNGLKDNLVSLSRHLRSVFSVILRTDYQYHGISMPFLGDAPGRFRDLLINEHKSAENDSLIESLGTSIVPRFDIFLDKLKTIVLHVTALLLIKASKSDVSSPKVYTLNETTARRICLESDISMDMELERISKELSQENANGNEISEALPSVAALRAGLTRVAMKSTSGTSSANAVSEAATKACRTIGILAAASVQKTPFKIDHGVAPVLINSVTEWLYDIGHEMNSVLKRCFKEADEAAAEAAAHNSDSGSEYKSTTQSTGAAITPDDKRGLRAKRAKPNAEGSQVQFGNVAEESHAESDDSDAKAKAEAKAEAKTKTKAKGGSKTSPTNYHSGSGDSGASGDHRNRNRDHHRHDRDGRSGGGRSRIPSRSRSGSRGRSREKRSDRDRSRHSHSHRYDRDGRSDGGRQRKDDSNIRSSAGSSSSGGPGSKESSTVDSDAKAMAKGGSSGSGDSGASGDHRNRNRDHHRHDRDGRSGGGRSRIPSRSRSGSRGRSREKRSDRDRSRHSHSHRYDRDGRSDGGRQRKDDSNIRSSAGSSSSGGPGSKESSTVDSDAKAMAKGGSSGSGDSGASGDHRNRNRDHHRHDRDGRSGGGRSRIPSRSRSGSRGRSREKRSDRDRSRHSHSHRYDRDGRSDGGRQRKDDSNIRSSAGSSSSGGPGSKESSTVDSDAKAMAKGGSSGSGDSGASGDHRNRNRDHHRHDRDGRSGGGRSRIPSRSRSGSRGRSREKRSDRDRSRHSHSHRYDRDGRSDGNRQRKDDSNIRSSAGFSSSGGPGSKESSTVDSDAKAKAKAMAKGGSSGSGDSGASGDHRNRNRDHHRHDRDGRSGGGRSRIPSRSRSGSRDRSRESSSGDATTSAKWTPEQVDELVLRMNKIETRQWAAAASKAPYPAGNDGKAVNYTAAQVRNYPAFVFARSKNNVAPGAHNLGLTCYLNASIQMLFSVPGLAIDLISARNRITAMHNAHRDEDTKLPLTNALIATALDLGVLRSPETLPQAAGEAALWSKTREKNLFANPKELKKAIDSLTDWFHGYQQQDAHEVIGYLIDALHDELVAATKEAGENDDTLLTDKYFRLEAEEQNFCVKCNFSSGPHSVLYRIAPIAISKDDDNPGTVEQLLEHHFSREIRELKCEECPCKKAFHAIKITKKPAALLLCFKRYGQRTATHTTFRSNVPVRLQKSICLVPFCKKNEGKREDLDQNGIEANLDDTAADYQRYKAVGVIYHTGRTPHSGHYTANALRSIASGLFDKTVGKGRKKWVNFDDWATKFTTEDAVLSSRSSQTNVYMAMYVMHAHCNGA